jgi:hypothetical protein
MIHSNKPGSRKAGMTNSSQNQIHKKLPQDTSPKNRSRESEPQPIDQEKPEDEKRRAS